MKKGQTYQKKIDVNKLSKLYINQNKTAKQVAKYFNCSIQAVKAAIKKNDLRKKARKAIIKQKVKKSLQNRIFREINTHVTTAQGMINEIENTIQDNVSIHNYIKQSIKDSKRKKLDKNEIKFLYDAQDKLVQRMKDYRELHKDLLDILDVQKFKDAFIESFKKISPVDRKILIYEFEKRGIVSFSLERLLDASSNPGTQGDSSRATSETITHTSIIQQEQTILA